MIDAHDALRVDTARGESIFLLYWEEGGRLFVMPSSSAARWLSEVLRAGGCEVRRPGGSSVRCSAELVSDPTEAERARAGFRTKYGVERYGRYFGPRSKVVRLVVGAPAVSRSPPEILEQEFDAVAAGYTEAVRSNPIEVYLKETTRDRLLDAFRGQDALLEIGGGTGFETIPLLSAGHGVTVVDLSARMLAELSSRARAVGADARLDCRRGRLSQLEDALQELPAESFGGAFSTFGAFNLEEDLGSAPGALARVLRPRTRLIFTTLNRPGALPVAWEIAVGNARNGLGRLRTALPSGSIRYPLTVYPRNPSFWDRALAPHFRRLSTLPVSVAAPPFESARIVRWLGAVGGARARRWDERLSRIALLAPIGEWTFLTYERLP